MSLHLVKQIWLTQISLVLRRMKVHQYVRIIKIENKDCILDGCIFVSILQPYQEALVYARYSAHICYLYFLIKD